MSALQPAPHTSSLAPLLELTLQRAGWQIEQLEIDTVAGRVLVELRRFDGRRALVHADSAGGGRAYLERTEEAIRYVTHRGVLCERRQDVLLGRRHYPGAEGFRSALRSLTCYVADNPAPGFPAISGGDIRRALAPFLAPRALTDGAA